MRRIGPPGLAIIKSCEKLRLRAYLPTPNDVPTIGYGHTEGVKMGDVCTAAQAEKWLIEDCDAAEICVNGRVKLPITDNQFDALVSLVFNIGINAFASSTLLRKLNSGDYAGAAAEFKRWRFQKGEELAGLVKRRERERKLFLTETRP
jgi:lysozyme